MEKKSAHYCDMQKSTNHQDVKIAVIAIIQTATAILRGIAMVQKNAKRMQMIRMKTFFLKAG